MDTGDSGESLNQEQPSQGFPPCTVMLSYEGVWFKANAQALASCSSVLGVLLSNNETWQAARHAEFAGVTVAALQTVIRYSTDPECLLPVDVKSLGQLLVAARQLQIKPLEIRCVALLGQKLVPEQCVLVLEVAEQHGLEALTRAAYRCVGENLLRLAHPDRLTVSQLTRLLTDNVPIACFEIDVLRFLLTWLEGQPRGQIMFDQGQAVVMPPASHVNLLRNGIRYGDILRSQITSLLATGVQQPMRSLINTQLCQNVPASHERIMLRSSRGLRQAMLAIGGECSEPHRLRSDIGYRFLAPDNTVGSPWLRLTSLPGAVGQRIACAVLANMLYVLGTSMLEGPKVIANTFWRYCPLADEWAQLSPCRDLRLGCTITAVDGHLVVVGGNRSREFGRVSTCESYDPVSRVWSLLDSLPVFLQDHAAVAAGDVLYVSGGWEASNPYAHPRGVVWNYIPRAAPSKFHTWRRMPALRVSRTNHTMVLHAGRLFVCGGFAKVLREPRAYVVRELEMYDLQKRRPAWKIVKNVTLPDRRSAPGWFRTGDNIYIVGGVTREPTEGSTTATLCRYDVANKVWETTADNMPHCFSPICLPMLLPAERNDPPCQSAQ